MESFSWKRIVVLLQTEAIDPKNKNRQHSTVFESKQRVKNLNQKNFFQNSRPTEQKSIEKKQF